MGNKPSRTKLSPRAPGSGSQAAEYRWECPYCKGRGVDPYNQAGIKNCPACHGRIFWESEVKLSKLERCGNCDGSGKTDLHGTWKICPACAGSGRV
jgi:DnaJ-class molecular chaperone